MTRFAAARTSASTSPSTGTTSSRSTAIPTGRTTNAGRCSAAWAEQTSRIEIGALVTCNSYRNPELLADMARTVDNISDGRLILGIGSGWKQKDYDEYGYEFGTAGSRLDDLAAALPRIKSRLAKLNPPPIRDIPILIGGGGEKKTLRQVAEHGDIWHSFSDSAEYPRKAEILARHCSDVGRDPATIERSAGVEGDTEDALVAEADALVGLGVSLLTVGVNGPDYDLTQAEALCRWRDRRQSRWKLKRCNALRSGQAACRHCRRHAQEVWGQRERPRGLACHQFGADGQTPLRRPGRSQRDRARARAEPRADPGGCGPARA